MNIKKVIDFHNYNKEVTRKTKICLHTTAGYGVDNVINYWKTRYNGIGTISTPYIIGRDGVIHQLYSPQYWSHHSGNGDIDKNIIGIEIENAGVGKKHNDGNIYNDIGVKMRNTIFNDDTKAYHDFITKEQVDSLVYLLNVLCNIFNIECKMSRKDSIKPYDSKYGIVTHRQINENKTDIPLWVFDDIIYNRNIDLPFL